MTRVIPAFVILLSSGCYDLSFEDDDHVVDELKMLAIHASPPEVRPGEPIDVELLYIDPLRGERPVWVAWRIFYPSGDNSAPMETTIMANRDTQGGQRVTVVPYPDPSQLYVPGFYTRFEVFLCAGDIADVDMLRHASTPDLFESFCIGAPLLTGAKNIGFGDALYPQNNPIFERIDLNGECLSPEGEGAENRLECTDLSSCAGHLKAYVEAASMERYVDRDWEGNAQSDEREEIFRVEWFVTSGHLMILAGGSMEWHGPYENYWYPEAAGSHTLWAVLRDNRGGNSWLKFTIDVAVGDL